MNTLIAILKSKVTLSVMGLLLATLVILYLLGRKSAHAEVVIPAPPESVWAVLSDTSAYSEWNPVFVGVEGELREEAALKYGFKDSNGKISAIESMVVKLVENELLNQSGGLTLVLTFDHTYRLERAEGGTRVIIHEEYRGIGVPFWDPSDVETAYQTLGDALKERVTQLGESGDSGAGPVE